ncbi:MAG: nitroreductase family protein [Methanomassiliicoccales archaeon]|nr:MAG: nitroreductase family protein [Methanomassiliicoccales archaeon]
MNVDEAVQKRRAKRAISTNDIPIEFLGKMVEAMRLAPSCNNQQPWRVVAVRGQERLAALKEALTKGNRWATRSPMVLAVCAKQDDDCQLSDNRNYFLFGCGLAVGQMLLQATELGIIAHPIAGYDPLKVKEVLKVPHEYVVITLVICGYPDTDMSLMSEKQIAAEAERPVRKPIGENFFKDEWGVPLT